MTIIESLWWKYRHRLFPRKYTVGVDRTPERMTVCYVKLTRRGTMIVDRVHRAWYGGSRLDIRGEDADKIVADFDNLNKRKEGEDDKG